MAFNVVSKRVDRQSIDTAVVCERLQLGNYCLGNTLPVASVTGQGSKI
jgi:hypothetical protein